MKSLNVSLLALSILMGATWAHAGEGKQATVVVAATDQTPTASVAAQPGRSPFFLFFDGSGTFVGAVVNPYKDQGASGISAVDFLASKGVTALVAESFGPRIVGIMQGKGIRPVEYTGEARAAVQKVLESQ